MVAECDPEGRQNRMLREISDHQNDNTALNVADGSYFTRAGNTVSKKATRGWKLLMEWVDGSMDWVKLSEVKEAYPVQLAEYTMANGMDHEPAFKWWTHKMLERKERIIKKVKRKYWRTTCKLGIKVSGACV